MTRALIFTPPLVTCAAVVSAIAALTGLAALSGDRWARWQQ